MLPGPIWRLDATLRLFAGVVVFALFASPCVSMAAEYFINPRAHGAGFVAALGGAIVLVSSLVLLLRQRWTPEFAWRRLILLVACFYMGLGLIWAASRLENSEAATLPTAWRIVIAVAFFQGAALWLANRFLRDQGVGWAEGFGLRNSLPRALWIGFVAGLAVVPIMGLIQSGWIQLLEAIGVPAPEQEAVQLLRASTGWATRLAIGVTAILIAPFAEEMLFRGVLYPVIKRHGFPRMAVWLSAILFGVIHGNLASFVALVILALVLIWLYESTGNLAAPVAAHTVFNSVNFVMLFVIDARKGVLPT